MRGRRFGLSGAVLLLALWRCGAARAQEAVPAPGTGVTAPDAFSMGPLAPKLADQVRTLILEQLKAAVPPSEEGSVSVSKLEKGKAVSATVGPETYRGSVYRMFLVEEKKDEHLAVKECYIRTTAQWNLKDGVVAPAETYFSLVGDRVLAFDAPQVIAQDAAIAKSEALSKAALDQLEQARKAKVAEVVPKYQAQADKLAANVTQFTADATQKQAARDAIVAQVNRQLQTRVNRIPPLYNGKDAAGKILWQFANGQFAFYDGLDKIQQDLADARKQQGALQATTTAEQGNASALFAGKIQAVKGVFTRERKRILVGDQVGDDEMRADYEAALGEALKTAAAAESKPADSTAPKP